MNLHAYDIITHSNTHFKKLMHKVLHLGNC